MEWGTIIIIVLLLIVVGFSGYAAFKKEKMAGEEVEKTPEVAKVLQPAASERNRGVGNAKNSDDLLLQLSQTRQTGDQQDMDWNGVLIKTELDPGVQENHTSFIKDVKNFSSTASFTNVADDNTNPIYTNFVGLRRPEYVSVGDDRRQVQDVDENVLKRNTAGNIRWGRYKSPKTD